MTNEISEIKHIKAPLDGAVYVTVEPVVTEKEIVQDREGIIQTLHAAYLNLVDEMAEFQAQWDVNPTIAFISSAKEGVNQGGASWLNDQADLFDKKTWIEIATKAESIAETSVDRLGTYARKQFNDIERAVNKHLSESEDVLHNWAWWERLQEHAKEAVDAQVNKLNSAKQSVESAAKSVICDAKKAVKIYKHRQAIFNLPNLIANNDPKGVQAFVENELADIDPELAKVIRNDPNFARVLELIADHESALTYLAYVGLIIEAIPPNFYAYSAGKGAAYIVIELVLLIITALLSAGAAAATRIAQLVARFALASARISTAGKKIKKAKAAIDAFIRAIEDLSRAVEDLHALSEKLVKARSKGLVLKGSTKTQLHAKKDLIRRDKKCRLCGSTQHSTPRSRRGKVEYE
ncbi:hypothetical protein HSX11_08885 [Oxalobacteraceae bacterium]|nr:hypothetical protein [Oxalobacteraceae bacterium]